MLDDAVFERMVGNDHDVATDLHHFHCLREGVFQNLQFVIDGYAQGLKNAGKRLAPMHRRGGSADNFNQPRSVLQRLNSSRLNDCTGDAPAVSLLTIGEENVRQFLFRALRYDVCCSHCILAVHSHVERAFKSDTEASLRYIYLMRRHAQVKQDAIDQRDFVLLENVAQMDHIAVNDSHTAIVGEQLLCVLYCVFVLVKTKDATILSEFTQQKTAMTAASERPVYIDPSRIGDEKLDRTLEKYRYVIARIFMLHHTPPMTRAATAS